MSKLKYWLWLTHLPQVSNQERLTLLDHLGTPEAVYYAEEAEVALTGVSRRCMEALKEKSFDAAEITLEACYRLGLRILTIRDTEYPDRLRNIYDPPVLLYVRGRLPLFDEEAAIAMVGTRKCTPYGVASAEKLSYAMAKQGALIVSGLAEGVDAAAHRGALRAGGFTAAVIGGGHDVVYPACNRYLYEDIAASGVILSEYPPGTEHLGRHFPVRNRIISGLSLGVVVVEAPGRVRRARPHRRAHKRRDHPAAAGGRVPCGGGLGCAEPVRGPVSPQADRLSGGSPGAPAALGAAGTAGGRGAEGGAAGFGPDEGAGPDRRPDPHFAGPDRGDHAGG